MEQIKKGTKGTNPQPFPKTEGVGHPPKTKGPPGHSSGCCACLRYQVVKDGPDRDQEVLRDAAPF